MLNKSQVEKFKQIQKANEEKIKDEIVIETNNFLERWHLNKINNNKSLLSFVLPIIGSVLFVILWIVLEFPMSISYSYFIFIVALWSIDNYLSYKLLKRMQDKIIELKKIK